VSERLDALSRRIGELLVDAGESKNLWNRAIAPLLRAFRWQPRLMADAMKMLLDGIAGGSVDQQLLDAAIQEAELNLAQIERASAVDGCPPIAHAGWLWRCYQILVRAEERVRLSDLRSAAPWHRVASLPPLTVEEPAGGRIHVDSIDPLLAAATEETEFLDRRRRLLEAARQLLLDTAAALPVESFGIQERQRYIANEIARINRLQAAGIDPDVALLFQARQALTRGETQRLHATLVAMEEGAARSGQGKLAQLSRRSLKTLWQSPRTDSETRELSLERSANETFDPEIHAAVTRGYERGRENLEAEIEKAKGTKKDELTGFLPFWEADREIETLYAAMAVDGCFDVGGIGSPVRVYEETRRARAAPFPTQDLVLLPARGVADVADAIITDPRSILLDLAAGRLLARRFVTEEVRRRPVTKLATEVRVYVLDGSGSMIGPRGRMRDAILIAELSTLMARFADASRALNPVLYFRYFTDEVGPATRVATRSAATQAIEEVLATVRHGLTNIEEALLTSFRQIREERDRDPELSRAQIVLVTDGEAPVDAPKILAARAEVAEVPIGVSIIALGQENPALRTLAARQRKAGERVFYHFVSDDALAAIVGGEAPGLPVHLPHDVDIGALRQELSELLNEMETFARREENAPADDVASEEAALAELGLTFDGTGAGHLARREAMKRDRDAVERRFDRWFPAGGDGSMLLTPAADDATDVDLVSALLASVTEVVELTASAGIQRQVDAIEIFERLMVDAGIPPWRYADLLRRYPGVLGAAVAGVRGAARRTAPTGN
jgi:Mg-chelatase subunit ChlD